MPQECFKCGASIAADDWVPHQQTFHLWHPEKAFTCMNCPYTSSSLAKTFGHLFLEGHQIKPPFLLEKRDDLTFSFEPAFKKVEDMGSTFAKNSNDSPKSPVQHNAWLKSDVPITIPNPFDSLVTSTMTVFELSDEDEDMSTNFDSSPESPNQIPELLDVSDKETDGSVDPQSPNTPNTSTASMESLPDQNFLTQGFEPNDAMAETMESRSMDAKDMSRNEESDMFIPVEVPQAASEADVISCVESKNEIRHKRTDHAATSGNGSTTTEKEGEEIPTEPQRSVDKFTGSISGITAKVQPASVKKASGIGRLKCTKCSAMVRVLVNSIAISHVVACNHIRPFSCSKCHTLYSEKGNLQKHINKTCPEATIKVVEKEQNEAAIRLAVSECFPSMRFNWAGLTNPPQKQQSQRLTSTENCAHILGSKKEYVHSQKDTSRNTGFTDQSQKQFSKVNTQTTEQTVRSSMPVVLPGELETIPDQTCLAIKCAKCMLEIKIRKEYRLTQCVQHVLVCLRLRSYQCTWCHYTAAFKSTVRVHLQQSNECRGAEVQMKDQKVDNEGVRRGLRECFPDNELWM